MYEVHHADDCLSAWFENFLYNSLSFSFVHYGENVSGSGDKGKEMCFTCGMLDIEHYPQSTSLLGPVTLETNFVDWTQQACVNGSFLTIQYIQLEMSTTLNFTK